MLILDSPMLMMFSSLMGLTIDEDYLRWKWGALTRTKGRRTEFRDEPDDVPEAADSRSVRHLRFHVAPYERYSILILFDANLLTFAQPT